MSGPQMRSVFRPRSRAVQTSGMPSGKTRSERRAARIRGSSAPSVSMWAVPKCAIARSPLRAASTSRATAAENVPVWIGTPTMRHGAHHAAFASGDDLAVDALRASRTTASSVYRSSNRRRAARAPSPRAPPGCSARPAYRRRERVGVARARTGARSRRRHHRGDHPERWRDDRHARRVRLDHGERTPSRAFGR